MQTTRMPAVFLGHGNPMNALGKNQYTEAWRGFGASIPKPRAILAVSAHWYTRGTAVTAMDTPRTIHDFGGFPPALYEVSYPAPGDPKLAAAVRDLLSPLNVVMDRAWGLDHGTWSVLIHAFPQADIPVVQLSIDALQPPSFHYELGKRLITLRDEGVLIVGSGNLVHNLRTAQWGDQAPPYAWAQRFNDEMRGHVLAREHTPLIEYSTSVESAALAAPTPEHFLPLLYVIGLQDDQDSVSVLVDGMEMSSISMLSFSIGANR